MVKQVKLFFDRLFSDELSAWLLQEMRLNKRKPLSRSQQEFWSAPCSQDAEDRHDPRGCPSYVAEYVENYPDKMRGCLQPLLVHRPHPNIVENMSCEGRRRLMPSMTSHTQSSSGDDEDSDVDDINDINQSIVG